MLTIRLTRVGRKNAPAYRVVVMEKSKAPSSRNLEILGHYNPRIQPKLLELKEDRIQYWLGVGAQPSDTVKNLLIGAGMIKGEKAKAVKISKKRQKKLDDKAATTLAATEEAKAKAAEATAKEAEITEPVSVATE
ncbi:30S ribosomal protein S16 [Candidatus Uhrbacteria bacterium RIFCSPLOWO2_01_FULL_53_9]|uniref:Small ribosomal subunit protein bS16 n=3 Tax=Candidatus Uhriibacteriota TaxID=1752732 RepID=A0A1F7UXG0_9BACT|nr:MAG: 30S ribosomal protein S16 [Candidatus Uhrbacteria bacterium RIFCSPHIGHO2_02_FULL_53_13]OGL82959.1 MAG: 30S ribosomal protein S16 [Candidatus Uhrbacteria bacterium RIFCSPLOWO2_01_FULL_53_9]OGL89674.1 MAG: 30S ribosomal protein S16 [Candidatus Uhrbacteria bacterium RIFCSPLOWO2_02_FULL_53_10]